MSAPVARLVEDQPVLAGEMPVSGRSQPRPLPLPPGFAHDIRFWPGAFFAGLSPAKFYLRVVCEPCDWSLALDGGHSLADLIRLTAQHAGAQDQVTVLTEALLRLCGHHVDHPMTWPHEDGA